jgi:glyoxylase-like metal-dependent hydrolase (beta-lactamase superfamily II)/8-oxo-dGTP pyrophosphatase MutT (NUDIX family)
MSAVPEAASVVLARGPGSDEAFVVRRADALRFFGGFVAFPGGRVHAGDADRRAAAARELFEETGVLLARRPDGAFPASGPDLDRLRSALLAERVTFPDLLAELGVSIRPDDLTDVGTLVTPPFSAIRFDTAFFTATLPPNQSAQVWPGELASGAWQTADAALRSWEAGEVLLSPPTVALLGAIRGRPVAELPARIAPLLAALDAGALHPIFFSPAVLMIPLLCRGLPPTTHTNAYLVGDDRPYLLDPGPDDPAAQARLFDLLGDQLAGRRLAGVVLTHQHPDHVGAAAACARRYGAPVLAHPHTARSLAGKVAVDYELTDGAVLDLGRAPHGGPWRLEALHTPGHAAGHLAFYEASYRLLFAGDMVSTQSSMIIAPPEGDLTQYLASLQRLRELPTRLLLPAHGSASSRPTSVIDECIDHRRKREAQLLEALAAGPRRVAELAKEMYRGTPAGVMRLAELQTLAGLQKLRREGKAAADGDGETAEWRLTEP